MGLSGLFGAWLIVTGGGCAAEFCENSILLSLEVRGHILAFPERMKDANHFAVGQAEAGSRIFDRRRVPKEQDHLSKCWRDLIDLWRPVGVDAVKDFDAAAVGGLSHEQLVVP